MSLFSDKEVIAAFEAEAKDKLRRAGLSRVRVRVTGNVSSPKIQLDADNDEDLKKAQRLFTD